MTFSIILECCYAECHLCWVSQKSPLLSVIMPYVFRLCVIMLNVFRLSVVMLNVMAPPKEEGEEEEVSKGILPLGVS